MEYYSVLRKKYCSMCNIDEPWGQNVKWNKPVTEELLLRESSHVRNLKWSNIKKQSMVVAERLGRLQAIYKISAMQKE